MLRAFTSFPSTTRPTKWLGFRRSGACRRLPQRPTVAPQQASLSRVPARGPGLRSAASPVARAQQALRPRPWPPHCALSPSVNTQLPRKF